MLLFVHSIFLLDELAELLLVEGLESALSGFVLPVLGALSLVPCGLDTQTGNSGLLGFLNKRAIGKIVSALVEIVAFLFFLGLSEVEVLVMLGHVLYYGVHRLVNQAIDNIVFLLVFQVVISGGVDFFFEEVKIFPVLDEDLGCSVFIVNEVVRDESVSAIGLSKCEHVASLSVGVLVHGLAVLLLQGIGIETGILQVVQFQGYILQLAANARLILLELLVLLYKFRGLSVHFRLLVLTA